METRPLSAALVIAAYRPVPQFDSALGTAYRMPLTRQQPEDSVEISAEARELAEAATPELRLFGQVRYDPPHTDDPDLPWEVQHMAWISLMAKVFGEASPAAGPIDPATVEPLASPPATAP